MYFCTQQLGVDSMKNCDDSSECDFQRRIENVHTPEVKIQLELSSLLFLDLTIPVPTLTKVNLVKISR